MRVVVASRNRHKVTEIGKLLDGMGLTLVAIDEIAPDATLVEDEPTFEANAIAKARQAAAATGLPALGDDSGLEVDALDGEAGVRSARWAGEPCDDARNNAKLVVAMRGIPDDRRAARFRCAAAFVDPARAIEIVRAGACEGHIVDAPRGTNGFGYDPHFFVASLGRTMADLTLDEKNRISHRAAAFGALAAALKTTLALCVLILLPAAACQKSTGEAVPPPATKAPSPSPTPAARVPLDAAAGPDASRADAADKDAYIAKLGAELEKVVHLVHEDSPSLGTIGTGPIGRYTYEERVPREESPHGTIDIQPRRADGEPLPADVTELLKRRTNSFRTCYERVLKRNPVLAGTVALTFTIAPDGTVPTADADEKGLADPEVPACVRSMARRLLFPKRSDGAALAVSVKLAFKPQK